MPNAFDFSISPFDALSPTQQKLVQDSVDIAYSPAGTTVLEVGATPEHLWVNIKGHVTEYEGEDIVASYGVGDVWDGRALVAGRASHRFVASEELLAYQVPRQTVMALIAENATFSALLFSDLGQKLSALSERGREHELSSLTHARVEEAYVRPAHVVRGDLDVLSVVRLMHDQDAKAVLVRDESTGPSRLGIFTPSAVQKAVLDGRPLSDMLVREWTQFSLVHVSPSQQIGDALALLARHRIMRLVVMQGDLILGMLEAVDVFSFLSSQSHLIAQQIEAAESIDMLAQSAAQITRMVRSLYRNGTRVGLIGHLVQDLQARLFDRAWRLIAPADMVDNSCLFVMGSEGRGEQLLKTDQDNALVWRDGYEPPADLQEICGRFSQALAQFGYPPCPGRIMLSNPDWRGAQQALTQKVRHWLMVPEGDALMNLAIFLDAHAVSGDADLLAGLQQQARSSAAHSDALLARFASAMDAFGSNSGWWNRLWSLGDNAANSLNLKKEGIFPLVHGVRSLALQAQLSETGTASRLEALAAKGVITATQASDWTQSLHFLMGLKLQAGLAEMDLEQKVTGDVDVTRLSTLERDLLKDALSVVRQCKVALRLHFRLDAL
jgi:CBS domain-containing protein